MKTLAVMLAYLTAPSHRHHVRLLGVLVAVFWLLVGTYSAVFHVLMAREGREFSWVTGIYWTLVTMTTVGFGDITFHSDTGRLFSVVVLLSGAVFLLVLLPFAFIQFVFVPWMRRLETERAPRELPASMSGHLILTAFGPIEDAVIRRARRAGVRYVIVVAETAEALRLHDLGHHVMVGALDDPATYHAARVEAAGALVATSSDTTNTNISFTVQEISARIPIIATVRAPESVDILQLAGADEILELARMLGLAMAQRVLGSDARSHAVGEIAGLRIAEAGVRGSTLVGRSIAESGIASTGVRVAGLWDRGHFEPARRDARIEETTVLVLAGVDEQFDAFDAAFGASRERKGSVVVIGGGRVGRQVGDSLAEAGIGYTIVEKQPARVRDPSRYVIGDAADLKVLEGAGLRSASSVVITTHDDDVNVYLTIYCRRLMPEIQVIARANLDRNVSTLYRAGADAVLSYAGMGATAIWNRFRRGDTLLLAEGLDVFRTAVPPSLAGVRLAQFDLREATGCGLVAVVIGGRVVEAREEPARLPEDAQLLLIGDTDAQERFRRDYPLRG